MALGEHWLFDQRVLAKTLSTPPQPETKRRPPPHTRCALSGWVLICVEPSALLEIDSFVGAEPSQYRLTQTAPLLYCHEANDLRILRGYLSGLKKMNENKKTWKLEDEPIKLIYHMGWLMSNAEFSQLPLSRTHSSKFVFLFKVI